MTYDYISNTDEQFKQKYYSIVTIQPLFEDRLLLTVAFLAPSWPAEPELSAVSLSPPSPWRPVGTVRSCRWRSERRTLAWTETSEPGWPKNPCSLISHPGRTEQQHKKTLTGSVEGEKTDGGL